MNECTFCYSTQFTKLFQKRYFFCDTFIIIGIKNFFNFFFISSVILSLILLFLITSFFPFFFVANFFYIIPFFSNPKLSIHPSTKTFVHLSNCKILFQKTHLSTHKILHFLSTNCIHPSIYKALPSIHL